MTTRATIATIAMRTRMSPYSTRPWPCSLPHAFMRRRTRSMRVLLRTAKRRGARNGCPRRSVRRSLDRGADLAEDRGDLVAEEDQGDDRHDGDEGEDQRVLRETLAVLIPLELGEERVHERHASVLPR